MPNEFNIDDLDRRLLNELQADPRKSNARLAKSLGITEPTVHRRIERLVSSAELVFTAEPDMKRFGYKTSASIWLQIGKSSSLSAIAEQLSRLPGIWAISSSEGLVDLIIVSDFKSNEALADFITDYLGKIEGILRIDTLVELKQIKTRTFGRIENRDMLRTEEHRTADIVIDEVDCRLILELEKDCRAPLKNLAQAVGRSEATVGQRMKKLVASEAIKLTAKTNLSKIGYPVLGFIGIEAELPKLAHVAESLSRYPQVPNVGIYAGPIQVWAAMYASSPESFINFANEEVAKIEGVVRIASLSQMSILKWNLRFLQ